MDTLGLAVTPLDSNPIALDGTIRRFEFCYEQAWKTLQRFARFKGLDPRSPRDAFRIAYKQGWIDNYWMPLKVYLEGQAKS